MSGIDSTFTLIQIKIFKNNSKLKFGVSSILTSKNQRDYEKTIMNARTREKCSVE